LSALDKNFCRDHSLVLLLDTIALIVNLAHHDEAVKHTEEKGEPKVVEAAQDREEGGAQVYVWLELLEGCWVLDSKHIVDYLGQQDDPRVAPGDEETHADRGANLLVDSGAEDLAKHSRDVGQVV